jgi:hypothetical protein
VNESVIVQKYLGVNWLVARTEEPLKEKAQLSMKLRLALRNFLGANG